MASAKGKRSRKKKGLVIDFEGVESGGGLPIDDGRHHLKVSKVTEEEGQDSGEPYLSFTWKVVSGPCKGARGFDNCSLQPQALWRLRNVLEALGVEVPDSEMELDISELVDMECLSDIVNEEHEGRDKPRFTAFLPLTGEEEEEEEEEESNEATEEEEEEEVPKKRSRKAKGGKEKKKKKLRAGSKVKFKDEHDEWVKGVIEDVDGDIATVDDGESSWEVELEELTGV